MEELTLDDAIIEAIALDRKVKKTDLGYGFKELDKAIKEFESKGYPIESILPSGETSLGFSLFEINGEAFWKSYSKLLRKSLCEDNGELNKLINSGINSSVGAVLTAIVTAIGLPAIALTIAIPIAVIIVNTGLKAFCEASEEN